MYLYTHSAGSNRDGRTEPPTLMSRTVGREMLNAAICRTTMKDTTSSKLSVHGPKQADAVHKAELMVLRGELKALPEGLRENARMNYLLDQNIKRKDLQDFQCSMIGKVEAILRKNISESGQDYRKYKVGGYDKGTYGTYIRILVCGCLTIPEYVHQLLTDNLLIYTQSDSFASSLHVTCPRLSSPPRFGDLLGTP